MQTQKINNQTSFGTLWRISGDGNRKVARVTKKIINEANPGTIPGHVRWDKQASYLPAPTKYNRIILAIFEFLKKKNNITVSYIKGDYIKDGKLVLPNFQNLEVFFNNHV